MFFEQFCLRTLTVVFIARGGALSNTNQFKYQLRSLQNSTRKNPEITEWIRRKTLVKMDENLFMNVILIRRAKFLQHILRSTLLYLYIWNVVNLNVFRSYWEHRRQETEKTSTWWAKFLVHFVDSSGRTKTYRSTAFVTTSPAHLFHTPTSTWFSLIKIASSTCFLWFMFAN